MGYQIEVKENYLLITGVDSAVVHLDEALEKQRDVIVCNDRLIADKEWFALTRSVEDKHGFVVRVAEDGIRANSETVPTMSEATDYLYMQQMERELNEEG